MVSLCRYFLFSLAIATTLSNYEASGAAIKIYTFGSSVLRGIVRGACAPQPLMRLKPSHAQRFTTCKVGKIAQIVQVHDSGLFTVPDENHSIRISKFGVDYLSVVQFLMSEHRTKKIVDWIRRRHTTYLEILKQELPTFDVSKSRTDFAAFMNTVLPYHAFEADIVIVQPGTWDIHFGKFSKQDYRVHLEHFLNIFRTKHLIFLHLLPDYSYSGDKYAQKYAFYNDINRYIAQNSNVVSAVANFSHVCSEDKYKNAIHPDEDLNKHLGSMLMGSVESSRKNI